MEASKMAPMILRLGRHRLRPHQLQQPPQVIRTFAASIRRHSAAPLPPSPEQATQTQTDASQSTASSSPASIPTPPRARRSLRPYLWTATFLLIGVALNGTMRAIIFPPPLPEPGSEEDEYLVSRYRSDLNNLPIVTELRKKRSAWREYDPYSQREAYGGSYEGVAGGVTGGAAGEKQQYISEQELGAVERHMTAGALRGAKGLAVQRAFYNAEERREITVVFFGPAIAGWPGVTHGGVLATILKESVERAASGPAFASRDAQALAGDGSAADDGSGNRRKKGRFDCDQLTLNYKKPTPTNNFYVVRAEVTGDAAAAAAASTVDGSGSTLKPGALAIKATIEDALTGQVKVAATATCSPHASSATESVGELAGGLWSGVTGLFGR